MVKRLEQAELQISERTAAIQKFEPEFPPIGSQSVDAAAAAGLEQQEIDEEDDESTQPGQMEGLQASSDDEAQ